MINILIITSRADFGGGPEHIYNLCEGLGKKINFFIACPKDIPYWDRFSGLVSNDNMIEIPHRKFEITTLIKLTKICREKKISIIHSHGKGAGIYGRLANVIVRKKCIHTFHGVHINYSNNILNHLYLFIEKILGLFSNNFVCVSEGEKNEVLKHNISKDAKIKIIQNGVLIDPNFVKTTLNNKLQILIITRFDYQKNTLLLLEIIKNIKDKYLCQLHFNIVGDGDEKKDFENEMNILNYDKFITLHGFQNNVSTFHKEAFCFISTSRWEGLPIAVIEAMSYFTPVIATNVVGNNDLIKNNQNGFLYGLDNPKEAAEKLSTFIENRSKWLECSEKARQLVVENYSMNIMLEKTFNLYKTVNNSIGK